MNWYGRTERERFDSYLEKRGDCLIWTGMKNANGYGLFGCQRADGKWRMVSTHRRVYEFEHGNIPAGLHVLHDCDTPACCNPKHLFLGTHTDNMRDMVSKGRINDRSGEKNNKAKLDRWDVLAIRHDKRPARLIATDYGMSKGNIDRIRQRKAWLSLPELSL